MNHIENKLIAGTGRKRSILRVKTGSEEFEWLLKNAAVYEIEADKADQNYSLVKALLLELEFNRFKKLFVHSERVRAWAAMSA